MTHVSLSARLRQNRVKLQTAQNLVSRLAALIILICFPNLLWAQESSSSNSAPRDEYTIRVNVDMVVLHATAQDHKNLPVSGLNKDDFHVYEDGALQQIKSFSHEDVPVTVGLVVDNSGSMKSKRRDVIAAALAFARSSNRQDQMFVINFNEKVSFGLPRDVAFTDQAGPLELALSRFDPDGETALYDAIAAAFEHLKKGTRDRKVLIVVSDGGDNASKHKLAEIMALAGQPDVVIYTIGIFDDQDADRNPGVLKRLAKQTGGESFLPESLKDVTPVCERIAHDIRNQYTIAYIPTNRKRDEPIARAGEGHGRRPVHRSALYPRHAPSGSAANGKGH